LRVTAGHACDRLSAAMPFRYALALILSMFFRKLMGSASINTHCQQRESSAYGRVLSEQFSYHERRGMIDRKWSAEQDKRHKFGTKFAAIL